MPQDQQQRYICNLDLAFDADNGEMTREALQEVWDFADSKGFTIMHAELQRAREDKPVEMFCLGSSRIYQNNAAEHGTTEPATA